MTALYKEYAINYIPWYMKIVLLFIQGEWCESEYQGVGLLIKTFKGTCYVVKERVEMKKPEPPAGGRIIASP